MEERISDLSLREVIDLDSGRRLGRVRDALVDTGTGRVTALIVPGRLRCLGLLGREEEILLPWETLEKLGEDILLVRRDKRERQGLSDGVTEKTAGIP